VRLYLETSVPNFLFVTDAPEKRLHTERLFAEIALGRHEAAISELYTLEIERTPDPDLRAQLEAVVATYRLDILPLLAEVSDLADVYIAAEAFTAANRTDAEHVALAVLSDYEVIVSWNFQHIVRAWTIQRVLQVNRRQGLPPVVICTPEEVN
jgi:hypothetical protein